MTEELLGKTYEALDEIKSLPAYLCMLELKKRIDVELLGLLEEFKQAKVTFEKAKENVYSSEYKKACQNLSSIKETLYTNELVMEYKEKEKAVQSYLDELMHELVVAARGE